MNRTIYILIICLLMHSAVFAQMRLMDDNGKYISGKSVADIDLDGVSDTLVFDSHTKQLSCLLSSRNFDTLLLGDTPEEWRFTDVGAYDGGIEAYDRGMNYSLYYAYSFEKETGKFRLTRYTGHFYGNSDNSGNFNLNLKTGRLRANWNYFDYEQNKLLPLPKVDIMMECPAPYWGDDDSQVDDIVHGMSRKYTNNSKMTVDTLTILSHKVAVRIDTYINSGDGDYLGRNVRPKVEQINESTCRLIFHTPVVGQAQWLEITEKNGRLNIVEEFFYNRHDYYEIAVEESDMDGVWALELRRKKVDIPIDGTIDYGSHFDLYDDITGVEVYHCPRRYSVEEGLKFMNESRRFTYQDFYDDGVPDNIIQPD